MATVTPYNDLIGTKTTGGTWAKISGPGPAAPGTYNGTLNFTGTSDGISIYSYTVTSGSCSHSSTISYNSVTPGVRTNDNCSGATLLYESSNRHYNDERCPGLAAPTNSGVVAATAWATTEPDLWYRVYVPKSASDVSCEVVVDGSPYSDGINQPMLAAYSGTCGALVEEDSSVGPNSSTSINFMVPAVNTPETIYIRVASSVNNAGQFDIIINAL